MSKKLFDFVIGNPPYMTEAPGESTSDKPCYHYFIDSAAEIADKIEMITPARFLFDAGATPTSWNRKMLADPHFKVLDYKENSSDVFSGISLMGGVAITYRDEEKNFGPIDTFVGNVVLRNIYSKVKEDPSFKSLEPLVVTRTAYRFSKKLHQDYPDIASRLSNGHAYDVATNIFEKLPDIFLGEKPSDGKDYISFLGREDNSRKIKYIRREYIVPVENLDSYKVILPKSNGAPVVGSGSETSVIGSPEIGFPGEGNTETFISIGKMQNEGEAIALRKYVCSKFARTLLGILKITQDNPPEKWKYVPLQDFTSSSDIDWSKPISDIDQQLYRKYGLSKEEIDFIETNVKEMQ